MRGFNTVGTVVMVVGIASMVGAVTIMEANAFQATQTMMGAPPAVGQRAPDFDLTSLDGARVRLSKELERGPVVLVVLRGFPTYQCPFCTRQFADYLARGPELEAAGARVLFVYPGDPEGLNEHAQALVAGRPLPANYQVLMDPDYAFTLAYRLRWEAPKETAYPSTFVIQKDGVIALAHVSHEHGNRVGTADVLKALAAIR